jgi:hypothetical protein
MKSFSLVLGTNIWSPHQVPLGRELSGMLGRHFKMVLFDRIHDERLKTGWGDIIERPTWLAGPPESESDLRTLNNFCQEADVALLGGVPSRILEARVATGKLTFVVAERKLKKPFHRLRMLNPRYAYGILQYRRHMNHTNLHALAIGHYAPGDPHRLGVFGDRIWRWAYFVELNPEPPRPRIGNQLRVLWVGRMLQLKRVDMIMQQYPEFRTNRGLGGV